MSATASDESSGPGTAEPSTAGNLDLVRQVPLRLANGWAGFDDDALYVEREGERTRVAFDDLSELAYRDVDYFVVVLSIVLVGFGLWFVQRNPAALLFTLVGAASLVRLYRHRGELVIRVTGRAKPLTFHPADAPAFYDALGETMGGEIVSDRQPLIGS